MNTLIRYLVLSETAVFVYARNHPLFRTIRDDYIFHLLMWVYNIDSPIIPNENRWTFSDFRSIHSSFAEYLWGVCFCALHGCAYWIDRWYRCACVGAYCIRFPIIPNENRWTFSDFRSIHSSLAGCLWGVCFCALHGYAYLLDRWYRYFQVGVFLIDGR